MTKTPTDITVNIEPAPELSEPRKAKLALSYAETLALEEKCEKLEGGLRRANEEIVVNRAKYAETLAGERARFGEELTQLKLALAHKEVEKTDQRAEFDRAVASGAAAATNAAARAEVAQERAARLEGALRGMFAMVREALEVPEAGVPSAPRLSAGQVGADGVARALAAPQVTVKGFVREPVPETQVTVLRSRDEA